VNSAIQPAITTKEKLEDFLVNLRRDRENVVEDIRKAMDLQPGEVDFYITNFNHDGNYFKITGIAPDEDMIFEYARELRRTGRFSQITVSAINQVEIQPSEEGDPVITLYEFKLTLE